MCPEGLDKTAYNITFNIPVFAIESKSIVQVSKCFGNQINFFSDMAVEDKYLVPPLTNILTNL